MRRNLNEQLNRMLSLMKVDKKLFEDILDKKTVNPADIVTDDVKKFFDNLEQITEPLYQQSRGSYEFKKGVETVQIGLILLGYKLPVHGVDGLFGPETAGAVKQFKLDNNLNEKSTISSEMGPIEEMTLVQLNTTSYPNVKFDNDNTQYDQVNQALLDDLQKAAEAAGIVVTITTAKHGHNYLTKSGHKSRHMSNTAVDIAILDGETAQGATNEDNGNPEFRRLGYKLRDALMALGYSWNKESGNPKAVLWQTNIGGNHFNHLHVSNNIGASEQDITTQSFEKETITPEMVVVLSQKLKEKDLKPEDIAPYVTQVVMTGGSDDFTDLDLTTPEGYENYKNICQAYINTKNHNILNINGDMMAKAAKDAFVSYGKYVPPELALSQLTLEGGFTSRANARPIFTANPFNVGNTDKGKNRNMNIGCTPPDCIPVEKGIKLYYDTMARDYLKNRNAADLMKNFVNKNGYRYASGEYEEGLSRIIPKVKQIAKQVTA